MQEWDFAENYISSKGYFTIYSPHYNDIVEFVDSFDCRNMSIPLSSLASYYEDSMDMVMGSTDEEKYNLIGINSNSFTPNSGLHNIFAEWDSKDNLPDVGALRAIGGTIIETAGGIHFFKEANITLSELKVFHKKWHCCQGFTSHSYKRGYACLRVCPKGNNHLRIIHKEDSFLHNVYEQIVKKLEEVHNGMAR